MSLWLTPAELFERTGKRQKRKQCEELARQGVRFTTRADGFPLVDRYQPEPSDPPPRRMTSIDRHRRMMRDHLARVVLPLDQLRGLPNAIRYKGHGIYFLWNGPQLVYIGQSKDVWGRMDVHTRMHEWWNTKAKTKQFTAATVSHVPLGMLKEIESEYIEKYEPPYNKRAR